jgi:hypothetical protein
MPRGTRRTEEAMHVPYRIRPEPREHKEAAGIFGEELVLALVMLGFGGLRVAIAIATGEVWGAEPSIAMLMLACGAALLLRTPPRSAHGRHPGSSGDRGCRAP